MRTYKKLLLGLAAAAMLVTAPPPALAQHVGFSVGFGFGYQYPWYPYGYPYFYPYGYPYAPYWYPYYYGEPALRLAVKPATAEVYVDGYRAGVVDNFDGVTQRLHVAPGGHEIVLYLEGYRTVHQSVYVPVGETQTIRLTMEKLPAGQTSGPRPEPSAERTDARTPNYPEQRLPPGIQAGPPQPLPANPTITVPPMPPGTPPPTPTDAPPQVMPMRPGTLSIRAQPADAEIWLDGTIWHGDRSRAQVLIQMGEGVHKLELKKAGYDPFSADVMVRMGQTTTVTVTLTKGQ